MKMMEVTVELLVVALKESLSVTMANVFQDHGNVMYTGVIVQTVKMKLIVVKEVTMLLLLQEQLSLQTML